MKLNDREKQRLIGMATTLAIYDVAEQEDYLKIMEIYAKAIERETKSGREAVKHGWLGGGEWHDGETDRTPN